MEEVVSRRAPAQLRARVVAVVPLVAAMLLTASPASASDSSGDEASELLADSVARRDLSSGLLVPALVWGRVEVYVPAGLADPSYLTSSAGVCGPYDADSFKGRSPGPGRVVEGPAGPVVLDCVGGVGWPARRVWYGRWEPAARRVVGGLPDLPGWGAVEVWRDAPDELARRLSREVALSRAEVLLAEHVVAVYDAHGLVALVPMSAGSSATPTPPGRFQVRSRSRVSVALSDRSVHIESMVRFNGGVGFHSLPYRVRSGAKEVLPTPLGVANVSLGCVRLADLDAAWLFRALPDGATVDVVPG